MYCPSCKKDLSEYRMLDTQPQFISFTCVCGYHRSYETSFFGTAEQWETGDTSILIHNISQEYIDTDHQALINPKGRHKLKK